MKKRLVSALLVLVMLASMIVMPVSATETDEAAPVGYCRHCKTVIPEDEWIPWDVSNTGPRSGHYYLDRDIDDHKAQITINLDDDLCRNVICLDLRGRSYSTTTKRGFLIYGVFSIMDSVGGGEINCTGSTGNANGTFCQMSKKSGCVDGAGELNLYSGTIRRVKVEEAVSASGGLIYLSGGSTFNMYGGKLVGGIAESRLNSAGTQVSALGGMIHVTAANVNLYGGVVTGGIAKDGFVTQADGTVKEYSASGGNIYAEKNAKILIDGATVENGYSEGGGGNIYLKDATLEMRSGMITGGYAEGACGNVNIGGASTFIMSGGVIKSGVCKTTGGNLRVNNSSAVLDISGGEIYGDIYANLFKSLTLSGAPKIYMGLSNGLRLYNTKTKLNVAGLTEGAQIYLDGVDQTFTPALENAQVYASYFKDAVRADITVTENGELAVAQGSTGFCPHCWQSGEQATWTLWHNNNNTSTSTITETASTHYYLTGNITRKGIVVIGKSKEVTDNDVVFDIAGKTWTTAEKKIFNLYSQLSLLDSIGGGQLSGNGHEFANGGVIMGSATAVFNMYSGTLARTVKTGEEMRDVLVGGVVYAPSGSVINIYGGTIRDGISASISDSGNYCRGGNVCAYGSFNMTAGALIGGKAYANSYVKQDINDPVLVKNSAGEMVPGIRGGMGGNLYVSGNATISGGHIIGGNATAGGNVYIASSATPSVSGCVIRDGVADETIGLVDPSVTQSMYGGNLYVAGSSSRQMNLVIENTIFRSGDAVQYGGSIYATSTDLTLRDCCVLEGSATRGGNLYLSGSVVCDMYDTVVSKGYASGHGGNLYGPGGVEFHMHSGLFHGGQTKGYGGNLYCNGYNMYGGVVTNGVSDLNGGNIYVYEGENNFLNIRAAADVPAPLVSNGKAGNLGGNIALGKNTTGTITGAIIENGTGDTGNKSSFNGDNVYHASNSRLTLTDAVIRGIVSENNYGNGVYVGGELILAGATSVTNEDKKSCIYISSGGKLTVDAGFTGESSVAFEDVHFENPEEPQGGTVAEQNTATGPFTGKLLLEGYKSRDYGLPAVFAEEADSKFYIASTAVIDPALDTIAWYRNNEAAAEAVTASSYLKLYKAENDLDLNRDLVIDLNGKNLSVTGSGKLSCFDSKNDDYTACGNLTTEGDITAEKVFMAPNGRRYIALESETGISFHRLGIAVTGVALRPAASGIYYKATWKCDDILKDKLESFGIAVSTVDMPKADFASDADTLYTVMEKDSFVSGEAVTSAMIENILVAGQDNQTRGTAAIYAAAYAVVDGMTVVADDIAPAAGGVIYSLQELMQLIDHRYPRLAEDQKTGIHTMYNVDAETLAGWQLYNITAAINGTLPVRPLKILTLGSSSSVDSNHMLNMVIAAEGGGAEVQVGTLYYSGCKLYEHVKFLQENAPVYTLYLSSTATPDKPPVTLKSVTMLDSILYTDWDIIFLQAGGFECMVDSTYTNGDIEIIRDYVDAHKTNPKAIFGWHCIGVSSTDPELTAMYPYTPNSYEVNAAKYNYDRSLMLTERTSRLERFVMSDPDYVYVVPSCTATENAITSYLGQKGIKRDYTHLTDVGRLIASYVWFCELYGVEQLEQIKVDAIPAAFLKSTADKTQDRVLTEGEKAVILEAVNNTLRDPLQITQSVYTAEP